MHRPGTSSPSRSHAGCPWDVRSAACARASIHPGSETRERAATMLGVATHTIRVFGDPVLKRPTAEVTDIDGGLVKLVDAMYETMHEAPGVGLAAPQVGVQKRFFVYEVPDETGPRVLFNPHVVEASGEWEYEEGCLSLPGLAFDIVRPKLVTVKGLDIDGNEVVIE